MKNKNISEIMREWHRKTDDNVVGVMYGYKTVNGKLTHKKSIVFSVKHKLPKEQISEDKLLPRQIEVDGKLIPTDVVQRKFKRLISDCEPTFYTWRNPATPPSNQDEWRPLRGGLSCANWDNMGVVYIDGTPYVMKDFIGTLGLLAIDNENNSIVAITNHHVAIYDAFICSQRTPFPGGDVSEVNNVKGDDITQPNEYGAIYGKHGIAYSIGKVKRYYPIRIKPTGNLIDAALITIDDAGDVNDSVSWYQRGLTPPASYPWASTAEINALSVNTLLYSTGRTTGPKGEGTTKLRYWGYGDTSISYNMQGSEVEVDMDDVIAFIATTDIPPTYPTALCYDPISGGDSGSALIANIGGVKKVVGLVFAGSPDEVDPTLTTMGIACRIDYIASLLNVSAWNGEAVNFSNTAATMEIAVDGLDDREYIDYGGNRYWQVGLRNK